MPEKLSATLNDSASFGHIKLHSPDSVDYRLEIAGIGARSHAFVIDWHIRLLLALAWVIAIGFALGKWQELTPIHLTNAPTALLLLWLAPAGIIFFLYHPFLEIAMSGRTPGKRIAGIRLVTLSGQSPGAGSILLRNVFRLVDSLPGFYGIGLVCVALTRHQVRIGDLAAGLVLVYDDKVDTEKLQRATNLALHSALQPEDQTLLTDLLDRWPQFNNDIRIRLGTQFLQRIGKIVPKNIGNQSVYAKELKSILDRLAEPKI